MNRVPMRLGRLAAAGHTVHRSGIRWRKDDGQPCRRGEIVAYCNVALGRTAAAAPSHVFFEHEGRDLQVGFAAPADGIVRRGDGSSSGGFLDLLETSFDWDPDFPIGLIECGDRRVQAEECDIRFFAGRRASPLAEVRAGLITGWYDRSRAWSCPAERSGSTLLSLGICEQEGVVKGDQGIFSELLDEAGGPVQAVYFPGNPLVPSARVLLDQLDQTPGMLKAIRRDFVQAWGRLGAVPDAHEWIFAGSLLAGLAGSPLDEGYDLLSRSGPFRVGPAQAVLLSMNSEAVVILRHKVLGYHIHIHAYRMNEAGAAVREWLRAAFEPVRRTLDMVKADLDALAAALRGQGREVLIMNVMSTSSFEDVFNYAPFDRPLGATLGSFRAKELNLMLHDLARERGIRIVDCDAIGADLGGAAHVPDGVHQSGAMQQVIREEIVHILAARGLPGFARAPSDDFELGAPRGEIAC